MKKSIVIEDLDIEIRMGWDTDEEAEKEVCIELSFDAPRNTGLEWYDWLVKELFTRDNKKKVTITVEDYKKLPVKQETENRCMHCKYFDKEDSMIVVGREPSHYRCTQCTYDEFYVMEKSKACGHFEFDMDKVRENDPVV